MRAVRHHLTAAALGAVRGRSTARDWLGLGDKHSWLGIWAALLVVPFTLRGPLPPDELRYLSVAWEMWSRGDILLPYLNGVPYDEKGPLLFWLVHAGWVLFGVNEWWPRSLPALLALSAIYLTRALCRGVWPDDRGAAAVIPWLLLGSFALALYTQVVMFDLLLVNATLLGLLGLERAERRARHGWLFLAVATALGLLTKGPVILLHLAGPGLLAPWWGRERGASPRSWYLGLAGALAGGIGVALAWAALAVSRGGTAYGADILFNQTAGRLVESFAHARPWWFHVLILPVLLLPWTAWPAAWGAVCHSLRNGTSNRGWRLLGAAVVPAFIAFSFMSGKQPHYLLPLVPPIMLLLATSLAAHNAPRVGAALPTLIAAGGAAALALLPLTDSAGRLSVAPWSPAWGLSAALLIVTLAARGPWRRVCKRLALVTPLVTLASEVAFFAANRSAYDASGAAAFVRTLQDAGHTIAHAGSYAGEFHFLGRLTQPLDVIGRDPAAAATWAAAHPDGYIVSYGRAPPATAAYAQQLRGEWLRIERVYQ